MLLAEAPDRRDRTRTTCSSSAPAAPGLRAAIEAQAAGRDVGLVCKSLLGKAHTVMAEGGVAAALGHVAPEDTWQIHFRDTMVGGKLLNNPRMAQLHAMEAPDRVRELELLGRRLRPDRRRPDPPAAVRRPLAPAARPRRRPDRPRDDPDAPGPRGRDRDRRSTWSARSRSLIIGPTPASAARSATGGRPASRRLPGQGDRPRDRRHRQGVRGHLELVGVQRRRPGARLRGRRRAHRHGVRPVPPDRDGLAARRPRPARDRGRPRRGRDPAQQGRRAVHVEVPPRGSPRRVRGDR